MRWVNPRRGRAVIATPFGYVLSMKNMVLAAAFLPNGELIVRTFAAIQRLDARGLKVLAKRAADSSVFAVSQSGRLFITDGNRVFEHNPVTLKPTSSKALPFPAERGARGALSSLAISPDDSTLAGITVGDTLHVQDLKSSASESHPGYGARREALAFLGPRTFLNVRGNTITEVRTVGVGHSDAELSGFSFASGGEGHFVAWPIGERGELFDAHGKERGPLAVNPSSAAFTRELAVVVSEEAVSVFNLDSRKQLARREVGGTGALAVNGERVAVGTNTGVVVLSLPGLEPLSALPAPPVKTPPPREKPAPKPKPARPSALRTKLEALGVTSMGGAVADAQLAKARKTLGHAVPKELAALWRDVDGFCFRDTAGGVNGLRDFLETSSEDVLWNDSFDEQAGEVPLGKLKKLKVLWSLPGQAEAVGIDSKTGKLFFGEPNSLVALDLTLAAYLSLALDPDFLEKIRAS